METRPTPVVRVVFACTGCSAPFRLPKSIDRQPVLSPAVYVAERYIYGQALTTIRTGDLYEDPGTEKHGRGRLPAGELI